jgi:hypothetical protein
MPDPATLRPLLAALFALAACATTRHEMRDLATGFDHEPLAAADRYEPPPPQSYRYGHWPRARTMLQGYFGANLFDTMQRSGGTLPPIDGSGESSAQMPVIGGGAQCKLAGDRVDLGVEAMLGLGWRSSGTAFVSGGSGAVVAVDVGLLLIDLYGGPFVNVFLDESVRVYAAAGPLMQWADYEQDGPDPLNTGAGTGFGLGYYTRAGIEADFGGTLIGLGVRWSQSTIDLSGGQGELDLDGIQVALTVAYWY